MEVLTLAKKGIDPRDAEAKRETEPTVAALERQFLKEHIAVHCNPSIEQKYSRSVRLFIHPINEEMPVSVLQRSVIDTLPHGLRDMHERSLLNVCRRVKLTCP